jgi:hypothetical protein
MRKILLQINNHTVPQIFEQPLIPQFLKGFSPGFEPSNKFEWRAKDYFLLVVFLKKNSPLNPMGFESPRILRFLHSDHP